MMLTQYVYLNHDFGCDLTHKFYILNIDKTAYDLTNYTASSFAKSSELSQTSYTLTATISNPTSGEITISIPHTLVLPIGRLFFYVYITGNNGTKTKPIEGILTVNY